MAILRAMGPRAEVVRAFVALSEGPDGSARDEALVAFARRLTLAPREADAAVADLRDHLSNDEVHDAIAVVGLLNFANRAALATGVTPTDDLGRA